MFLLSVPLVNSVLGQAPWLPETEQEKMRKMLPEGVPFSKEAKFYKLRQVFQAIYGLDSGQGVRPQRDISPVDDNKAEHPWKVSGGMHFVDSKEWRNATALDLGEGKIETWLQEVDAGAHVLVPKRFWRFPQGTLAYDVLIRKWPLGEEKVFEVRVHERLKDGWGNAKTFRPDVEAKGEAKHWQWQFNPTLVFANLTESRVNIKAEVNVIHVPPILGDVKFVDRREVLNDSYLIPKDYAGAGTSCTSCHSKNLAGQRTGYGTAVRGGDGRFTWHPWDEQGNLDQRWPLVAKK
jgi:hypothetical protein